MKTNKNNEPYLYEQRSRFDFTSNLEEVVMINGDSLDNYDTEKDRQDLLQEFSYLSCLTAFAENMYRFECESELRENFLNSLDKNTKYLDFVQKGTPEENGKTWFYEEWWEDDKGNKTEYLSVPHNNWLSYQGNLYYEFNRDTLPCITRVLSDGKVSYDYRLSDKENAALHSHLCDSVDENFHIESETVTDMERE